MNGSADMRERTLWTVAGLVGLVAAVALALVTSHMTRSPEGLSGVPISAGQALAPAHAPARAPARTGPVTTRPAPSAGTASGERGEAGEAGDDD